MKKQTGCDFEKTIVNSLKSGLINDEVSEHLKSCANCRETAKIVQFFQTTLKNEPPPKPLPAAGLVWWKFRLREKRRALERVAQPIFVAQTIGILAAFILSIWLMFNRPSNLKTIGSVFGKIFNSMEVIAFPFFTGVICVSFVCVTLIFTLRKIMPEK